MSLCLIRGISRFKPGPFYWMVTVRCGLDRKTLDDSARSLQERVCGLVVTAPFTRL